MSDNVLIAVLAASAVVISAAAASTVGITAIVTSNKRLDKIEHTLEIIQGDLKDFYRDMVKVKEKLGL